MRRIVVLAFLAGWAALPQFSSPAAAGTGPYARAIEAEQEAAALEAESEAEAHAVLGPVEPMNECPITEMRAWAVCRRQVLARTPTGSMNAMLYSYDATLAEIIAAYDARRMTDSQARAVLARWHADQMQRQEDTRRNAALLYLLTR
ncbi:hypothetical protein [Roseomonas xinghualingensis]|uniref:hypothetical protein n=1 Tax=Roseomonas xinghualingensis TaxID=2986475 RepID=UPI0021F0FB08|nr:hypothetical protein [Roseomonas sp. SXEYE001]MCV4209869.1 hypothetical protein [Roseomonas sp. SXEYE001]